MSLAMQKRNNVSSYLFEKKKSVSPQQIDKISLIKTGNWLSFDSILDSFASRGKSSFIHPKFTI